MKNLASRIINAVLSPFGRCRIKLGEWPYDTDAVVTAIKQRGGVPDGEGGMPTAMDLYHFRMPGGRRVTLTVIDYGAVILCGPKSVVCNLAAQLNA